MGAKVQQAEERIAAVEARVQAFLALDAKAVAKAASQVDAAAPLSGRPVAIKDNLCTLDFPTTCASKLLGTYRAPYEATAVARLRAAGAVVMGKTNMDEFGMGSSTENSAFQITRNPWDGTRVPGGSSGGSAAAVAAGEVWAALGSDTGGSIRQPAAFCGVVGLKPTYGRVSRYGLIAFGSSLDNVGPIARTVKDTAEALQAIAGHDPHDSTSLNVPVPNYSADLAKGVRGLRFAIVEELLTEGVDPEVRHAVEQAADQLVRLGAVVERVSVPHTHYATATYYLLAPAEASSNLARYDGVRYGTRIDGKSLEELYRQTRSQGGFGREVKRRILLGTYALSAGYYDAYYRKAQQVRTCLQADFTRLFSRYDALLGPTTSTTAFGIGAVREPLQMYRSDLCTIPASLAGIPALSIPCGLVDGLPVGLQILAPPLAESRLLQIAAALEQERGPLLNPPWEKGGAELAAQV